jgi:outer membrane immunogenic protein
MMKYILMGAAIAASLAFGAGAAWADGYGPRGGVKDYGARCASFHGFYIGANVGWGYHDHTWSDRNAWAKNEVDLALPSSVSGTNDGWLAGVQAGYNMQRGCTVFGLETDWSWANIDGTKLNTDGQPGLALDRLSVSSDVRSFGTVRTRAGVVVDQLLLYTTGGVAYAHMNSAWAVTNILGGVPVTERFATSDTRWGWVAGVGTEWQLTPSISIKSEALYVKFTDNSSTFNSALAALNGNPVTKNFDEQDAMWVGRIGVNYRFGCGSAC